MGRGERKERVQDRQGKTLPKLRTPGMSPYPSHSKSSVDWILHATGCLPKIKYKIHNFLFNCSLALVRISPGDSWESKYLTRFLHQHSHLNPPETTGLVFKLLWTWVCFPVCKTQKWGEVNSFYSSPMHVPPSPKAPLKIGTVTNIFERKVLLQRQICKGSLQKQESRRQDPLRGLARPSLWGRGSSGPHS